MICERCKKIQATFHLTNIKTTGEKAELHLCEKCAHEEGLIQKSAGQSFQELITSFVAAKGAVAELSELACEKCGMTFVEFRNQGLLGCPHDYEAFQKPLAQMIEKAQEGATHHTGKRPRSQGGESAPARVRVDLRQLKKQLDEAVAAEDYERAAELRDRIREVEKT